MYTVGLSIIRSIGKKGCLSVDEKQGGGIGAHLPLDALDPERSHDGRTQPLPVATLQSRGVFTVPFLKPQTTPSFREETH